MRSTRWVIGCLAIVVLAMAAGCWYQRPNFQDKYEDIKIGMTKEKVIKKLGQPTVTFENEMFYVYDDPMKPAVFVLSSTRRKRSPRSFSRRRRNWRRRPRKWRARSPPCS